MWAHLGLLRHEKNEIFSAQHKLLAQMGVNENSLHEERGGYLVNVGPPGLEPGTF
jgi:hypothetical protein